VAIVEEVSIVARNNGDADGTRTVSITLLFLMRCRNADDAEQSVSSTGPQVASSGSMSHEAAPRVNFPFALNLRRPEVLLRLIGCRCKCRKQSGGLSGFVLLTRARRGEVLSCRCAHSCRASGGPGRLRGVAVALDQATEDGNTTASSRRRASRFLPGEVRSCRRGCDRSWVVVRSAGGGVSRAASGVARWDAAA